MTSIYDFVSIRYNENIKVAEYCKIVENRYFQKYGRKFPNVISQFEIEFLEIILTDLDSLA